MPTAHLTDRGVVRVAGEDAKTFLETGRKGLFAATAGGRASDRSPTPVGK